MKEFIYLPVCAYMEGKCILCIPATIGLSGYDSYVKPEMFQNINLCG